MHPALVILSVVLLVQSISVLGKDRLQELFYAIYVRLTQRKVLAEQRRLRAEVFENKQALAMTSSQDEFAKWAKLRRKVDKGLQDLEKTNAALSSSRTTFSLLFKAFMFALTTVLPFCVTSYYGKTPIFWLPPDGLWFGPFGWFLSLPRAPAGSISSTVWQMVCTRTLLSLLSSLKSLLPTAQPAQPPVPPHPVPPSSQDEKTAPPPTRKDATSTPPTDRDATQGTASGSLTNEKGEAGGGARKRNVAKGEEGRREEL